MLQDVEDILDSWENTGFLKECVDPFNFAIILETQRRVNKRQADLLKADDLQPDDEFYAVAIATVLNVCRQKPDQFQGLIDFHDCKDVYRLGWLPRGDDATVGAELVRRILQLDLGCLYFGGLVLQDNRIYLIADPLE